MREPACKMISIMFPLQPLHDQRSNAYTGKERRRIPGLSKAQRRIKASSTPALLDRDVERWVVIFESTFIIHSILWTHRDLRENFYRHVPRHLCSSSVSLHFAHLPTIFDLKTTLWLRTISFLQCKNKIIDWKNVTWKNNKLKEG